MDEPETRTISNALASLEYTTYGATILSIVLGDRELLFLSKLSEHPQEFVRGGVPVIWPWFGKDARGKHGVARGMIFKLVEEVELPDLLYVKMELDTLDLSCCLEIKITDNAKILLTTTANADFFNFSAALHAYFAISNANTRLCGLGRTYIDALDDMHLKQSDLPSLGGKDGFDRIYDVPCGNIFLDELEITPIGATNVVLWNPGEEALHISDLEAWENFVCIEPALLNKSVLLRGEVSELGMELRVQQE